LQRALTTTVVFRLCAQAAQQQVTYYPVITTDSSAGSIRPFWML
jgi:hypothetical protein